MNDGERGVPRVPVSDSPDRRLPPRREQLPLPRRDGQSHLEPQLREHGGAGSGTPFEAFEDPAGDTADTGTATQPSGERVARFRDAVRRATGGSRRGG